MPVTSSFHLSWPVQAVHTQIADEIRFSSRCNEPPQTNPTDGWVDDDHPIPTVNHLPSPTNEYDATDKYELLSLKVSIPESKEIAGNVGTFDRNEPSLTWKMSQLRGLHAGMHLVNEFEGKDSQGIFAPRPFRHATVGVRNIWDLMRNLDNHDDGEEFERNLERDSLDEYEPSIQDIASTKEDFTLFLNQLVSNDFFIWCRGCSTERPIMPLWDQLRDHFIRFHTERWVTGMFEKYIAPDFTYQVQSWISALHGGNQQTGTPFILSHKEGLRQRPDFRYGKCAGHPSDPRSAKSEKCHEKGISKVQRGSRYLQRMRDSGIGQDGGCQSCSPKETSICDVAPIERNEFADQENQGQDLADGQFCDASPDKWNESTGRGTQNRDDSVSPLCDMTRNKWNESASAARQSLDLTDLISILSSKQTSRLETLSRTRQWKALAKLRTEFKSSHLKFSSLAVKGSTALLNFSTECPKSEDLLDEGILTYRDILEGHAPTTLQGVFAFVSLSFAMDGVMKDQGRQSSFCPSEADFKLWRESIQDIGERQVFDEITYAMWLKTPIPSPPVEIEVPQGELVPLGESMEYKVGWMLDGMYQSHLDFTLFDPLNFDFEPPSYPGNILQYDSFQPWLPQQLGLTPHVTGNPTMWDCCHSQIPGAAHPPSTDPSQTVASPSLSGTSIFRVVAVFMEGKILTSYENTYS